MLRFQAAKFHLDFGEGFVDFTQMAKFFNSLIKLIDRDVEFMQVSVVVDAGKELWKSYYFTVNKAQILYWIVGFHDLLHLVEPVVGKIITIQNQGMKTFVVFQSIQKIY